jgi:hypothetical protein
LKGKGTTQRKGYPNAKYYLITGGSGCPSAEYMYMSKRVTGGVMLGSRDSSANEYPKG